MTLNSKTRVKLLSGL